MSEPGPVHQASAPEHPAHEWFVQRYDRTIAWVAEWFEEDKTRGLVNPDRDSTELATHTIAMWDGLQLQWLIDSRRDMHSAMRAYFESAAPEALSDRVSAAR